MLKNKKFFQTSLLTVLSCAVFIGSTPQSCRALTATTAWLGADVFSLDLRGSHARRLIATGRIVPGQVTTVDLNATTALHELVDSLKADGTSVTAYFSFIDSIAGSRQYQSVSLDYVQVSKLPGASVTGTALTGPGTINISFP